MILLIMMAASGLKLSPLVDRIASEAANAWDLHQRAVDAAIVDPEVIVLSVGDHDFDTAPAIVASLFESVRAGRTHYSRAQGERQLCEAIAKHYQGQGFDHVSADRIVVASGAQNGLFMAAMCLLAAGDEIIIPEPMYVTYPGFVAATGACIVSVPLDEQAAFSLPLASVRDAITDRTQAILLNSPHNPTGAIIDSETLQGIAQLCLEYDLWLITDEVYSSLYFDALPTSALSLRAIQDRLVVVSSLSKSHAMTGWRVGWLVVPERLVKPCSDLLTAMLYGAPMFIQDAAVIALEQRQPVEAIRQSYQNRRDLLCQRLQDLPEISFVRPSGGMFVMIDIRATGLSATEFARRLYHQEKLSVLAADAFGPSAKGYVRFSLTVAEDRLHEACDRLARFLVQLKL